MVSPQKINKYIYRKKSKNEESKVKLNKAHEKSKIQNKQRPWARLKALTAVQKNGRTTGRRGEILRGEDGIPNKRSKVCQLE